MTYQLVFQFKGDALADFDMLVNLEDELQKCVATIGEVDGHDMGSGEMNIFVLTSAPTETFLRAKPLMSSMSLLNKVEVAYRELDADDFTVIWPENSTKVFDVA